MTQEIRDALHADTSIEYDLATRKLRLKQAWSNALTASASPSTANPVVTNSGWDTLRALIFRKPEDFGVVPDNLAAASANTVALQTAFTWCCANKRPLVFTAGSIYYTDDLVQVGSGSSIQSIHVTAHNPGLPVHGNCATIYCTSKTRPAINFQGIWGGLWENVGVRCENVAPSDTPTASAAAYVSSGFSVARYAPHAAIAIDAFSGTAPPGGGYAGATYGQYDSSNITFRHVSVQNAVIGFFNYGGEALASSIRFENFQAYQCAYGFATCQTQARANTFNSFVCGQCHTVWDGKVFGAQNGSAPGVEGLSEIVQCFRLFNIRTTFDVLRVSGIYAEAICALGTVGGFLPAVFTGCYFGMGIGSLAYVPIVHGNFNSGSTKFLSCYFSTRGAFLNLITGVSGAQYTDFDGCSFQSADSPSTHYQVCSRVGSLNRVSLRNCNISEINNSGVPSWNSDCDVGFSTVRLPVSQATRRLRTYGIAAGYLGYGDLIVKPSFADRAVPLTTTGAYTWDVGSVVFTAATDGELRVDDLLYWTLRNFAAGGSPDTDVDFFSTENFVVALKVTSVVGTTITAATQGAQSELDTTSLATTVYVALQDWAPLVALAATWSNGVNTLSMTPTNFPLQVGDFLLAAAGLPAIVRATAVNGGVVTLSKTTTAARTGEPIYCSRLIAP